MRTPLVSGLNLYCGWICPEGILLFSASEILFGAIVWTYLFQRMEQIILQWMMSTSSWQDGYILNHTAM
ncbi:MAG: hypothetical protein ACLFMP_04085 [Desulfonatronovibrionaceae bacterium]